MEGESKAASKFSPFPAFATLNNETCSADSSLWTLDLQCQLLVVEWACMIGVGTLHSKNAYGCRVQEQRTASISATFQDLQLKDLW